MPHSWRVTGRLIAVFIAMSLAHATISPAQDATGRISGVVVDTSDAPLPGQRTELHSDHTADRAVVVTDRDGAFTFTRLGPGRYNVVLLEADRPMATSGDVLLSPGAMEVTHIRIVHPPVAPPRRRASLSEVAPGGTPHTSFGTVAAALSRGNDVIVTGSLGAIRGRLASVDTGGLLLYRRTSGAPVGEEHWYRAADIDTIQVTDSRSNGLLLGTAVSAVIFFGAPRLPMSGEEFQGAALWVALGVLGAPAIGWWLDGRSNATVYQRPASRVRLSLTPLMGPRSLAIVGCVRDGR